MQSCWLGMEKGAERPGLRLPTLVARAFCATGWDTTKCLLQHGMTAAVLLPAILGGFRAHRLFLAQSGGDDAAGVHSGRDQCVLHRGGAIVTQREVVLRGAAFVAVSLDLDLEVGAIVERLGVSGDGLLRIGANLVGVVI